MNVRKAFVTGGSRGIGRKIVEQLQQEGYIVYAPTREELDLSDSQISDEEIERAMQINLISPLKILRAFVPAMKRSGYGKIVNIGSIWGIISKRGRTVYSITKH